MFENKHLHPIISLPGNSMQFNNPKSTTAAGYGKNSLANHMKQCTNIELAV